MDAKKENKTIQKKSKKKKLVTILLILFAVVMVSFAIYSSRYTLMKIYNGIFPPKTVEKLDLTDEEKLEDFEYLYDTLSNSVPMIDSYEEIYGFSFKDRKEEYRQAVLDTTSDLEFYAVMDAIIQEVSSFHTDMLGASGASGIHCYNSEKVSADRDVASFCGYWQSLVENENTISGVAFSTFIYLDGEYYYDPYTSTANDLANYDKIISINGVSADQYATAALQIFNLHYDGAYQKVYRTRLMFNDTKGDKCEVLIEHADKTTSKLELYMDNSYNEIFLSVDPSQTSAEPANLETFDDDDAKLSYVRLDSMAETDGDEVKKALKALKYDNVILDLRSNYGGLPEYAAKYVYPYLFSDDFTVENDWYLPMTDENKTILKNIYNRIIMKPSDTSDAPYNGDYGFKEISLQYSYKGKLQKNKNVIILTGVSVGSACDRFVSDVKGRGLATVIGNNTGGEGLADSYNCVSLPNSRLAFIYMPGGAKNPDGTDNSVYGTSPDVYISESPDCYYQRVKADSWEYADMKEYDNVLQEAIGQCTGN